MGHTQAERAHQLPPFILLPPPTLGLCLTLAPFMSPSSRSILAVLLRRLFCMFGEVLTLAVWELVLCCLTIGCELGDGVCIMPGDPVIPLGGSSCDAMAGDMNMC